MKRYVSLVCVLAMLISAFAMFTVSAEAPATVSKWDGVVPEANLDYHFAGEGTAENPYLIQSAAELAQFAANVRLNDETTCYTGKYFRLITDIDLDSKPWYGIGGCFEIAGFAPCDGSVNAETDSRFYSFFAGIFDGDNHKIYNLTLAEKHVNGLFGLISSSALTSEPGETVATVKNIGIESGSTNVTNKNRLGGVVGGMRLNSKVENCYNKSSITVTGLTSQAYIGGVVGVGMDAATGKTISHCYNTGAINVVECNSTFRVGGVVGGMLGKGTVIDTCYGFGPVTLTHNQSKSATSKAVGVLAGAVMDSPTLKNCYAHADISAISYVESKANTWHTGPFIGAYGLLSGASADSAKFVNLSYTQSANTYFGVENGTEKRWGFGNSATATGNSFLTEIPLAEAKTLADILPADLNGFLAASGNDAIATAPEFIGVQTTEAAEGKYSARFLLGLDSLDYDAAEFEIVATYEKDGQTVTAKNGFKAITAVYRDVLADGKSVTSISEGHNYMAVMVVNGIPADATISFEVKSFVYVSGAKTLVDTDTVVINAVA